MQAPPALLRIETGVREVRSANRREIRAEQRGGKDYLVGHAANYGVLSEDLGGFRERIMRGAFSRALREKQDIRHLQNHDPSRVLGRTRAGTTVLTEDAAGLAFETCLPDTNYARDLAVVVARKDVDEMSFGFIAQKDRWISEAGADVRELLDVDLLDISTVTYPAYPGTSAAVDLRFLFPDGVPAAVRTHLQPGRPPASVKTKPVTEEDLELLRMRWRVRMAKMDL
jgi:hypothetical protein